VSKIGVSLGRRLTGCSTLSLESSQKKSANVELTDLCSVSNIIPVILMKQQIAENCEQMFVWIRDGRINSRAFGPTLEYDIKIYFKKIASE
jgi:hypothetical protein